MDEISLMRELLLKVDALTAKVDRLQQLQRYVGLPEACEIVGLKRTAMTQRLKNNYYPSARKVNDRWRILVSDLYVN